MKSRILLTAVGVLLLLGAVVAWSHRHRLAGSPGNESETGEQKSNSADAGRIVLSKEKRSVLDLRIEPATPHPMQDIRIVAGRIQYNETKHVQIRAAANGILTAVAVAVGDRVERGQALATISSPEIGVARSEVHHSREKLELAKRKWEWENQISQNVFAFIDAIKSHLKPEEIEKHFQGRTLGKSRDVLMSAYAQSLLAQHLARTAEVGAANAVPAVTVEHRRAERRSTEAVLVGAMEQARFDATQERHKAEIEREDAVRQLNIAREQLTALLGYAPDNVPENTTAGDLLSRVEIRAPFDGTIEEKPVAPSERVRTAETILILADTKTLWVSADIREQDWRALSLRPGQEVQITTPALPGVHLPARIRHVGRQVLPETNSVPLIAEIGNPDGLLRPGLFVHVSIPVGPLKSLLAVPAKAVVEHEGAKFVFVQDRPDAFHRADVVTGMQNDDWIEIVRGLEAGAPVVTKGAADLKAEMLVHTLAKED